MPPTPIPPPDGFAEEYRRDGYAVLRGALAMPEVEALRAEALAICRGDRGDFEGIQRADGPESEQATLARYLCIHFPHKLSPLMLGALAHPRITGALVAAIGPNVKCMQSMLFIKASGKPGQAWHQDEFYIPTRDRSLVGAWIALDDAAQENGCLWAIPGSHRRGVLYPQRPATSGDYDCQHESFRFPHSEDEAVPLEAAAGDIVVFHGYLLHQSRRNRAPGAYRRALVNHYMSAESLLPWHPREGVHMAATDIRDIVMVAGEDPYAWKGTEEANRPYLRPSGESGCGDAAAHAEKQGADG